MPPISVSSEAAVWKAQFHELNQESSCPAQHPFYGFRRILALAVAFCLLCASSALARPINAKSAILMDVTTGRILYEQRADMKIPPASLTKVISMYVAHERHQQPQGRLSRQG